MSDREEKNAAAVIQAINRQNAQIDSYKLEIIKMERTIQSLSNRVDLLENFRARTLAAQFSGGPTDKK